MVVDAVRTYLEAANGLTELTRKRAVAAARTLLRESDEHPTGARAAETAKNTLGSFEGAVRGTRVRHSIQALAADLIETSRTNRAALSALVESEVERLLGRLDLVRREEHDRLVRRVAELEGRLASTSAAWRRRATEEVRQVVSAGAEQDLVSAPASAAEPVPVPESGAVEPEGTVRPVAAAPEQSAAAAPESAAAGASDAAPGSTAPAAPAAARSVKPKASGARSRSSKGATKRAASRKNSGSVKDGGK